MPDRFADTGRMAEFAPGSFINTRKHGNRQKPGPFDAEPFGFFSHRFRRRPHHSRTAARMKSHQIRPEAGQGLHRLSRRMGNVMNLQVEKDTLSRRFQVSYRIGPGTVKKLHPDLVERNGITQLFDKLFHILRCMYIEGRNNATVRHTIIPPPYKINTERHI